MIFDILILSSSPVLFLLWYFYQRHVYKRIPIDRMYTIFWTAFLLGFVAMLLETQISRYTVLHLYAESLHHRLGFLFFSVSFTEELIKLLPVFIWVYHSDIFEEPYDGIIYSVSGALGLAFLENVIYFMSEGVDIMFSRTLLALPTHVLTMVYAGYFLGMAHFQTRKSREILWLVVGFLCAMLIHFFYNAIFTISITYPTLYALCFLIALWIGGMFMIKDHIQKSPYRIKTHKIQSR